MPIALAIGTAAIGSFSAHVTNPWFPLAPGTQYVYSGVTHGH
jgi:hypothetical protein